MNNENWRITGERMQERLKALNMTQRELAEKTGKNRSDDQQVANSERIPLATEYTGLSKALKCTCDYLLGLSEDPSKTSKQEEQGKEGHMLETEFDCEESCLSCGDKEHRTIKVSIKRAKKHGSIIAFHLCRKCMNQLAREFYPFS